VAIVLYINGNTDWGFVFVKHSASTKHSVLIPVEVFNLFLILLMIF